MSFERWMFERYLRAEAPFEGARTARAWFDELDELFIETKEWHDYCQGLRTEANPAPTAPREPAEE